MSWRGPVFCALAVTVAGLVVFAAAGRYADLHHAPAPRPIRCVTLVEGQTKLYACANGHNYAGSGSHVQDVGPQTAMPKVPAA